MKKLFLTALVIVSSVYIYACSFPTDSFCRTLELFPDRNILTGQIIAEDSTGVNVLVIEVIRGEEARDTIRIWDGTDFECNGPWSLAASDIGSVGDTLVLMMPMITEIENGWDIMGDYRRGDPYLFTPELKVEGTLVKGFIKGIPGAPPTVNIWDTDYTTLKDELINAGDCADIVLSTEALPHTSNVQIINPFSSALKIQLAETANCSYLRLYTQSGQLVYEKNMDKNQLNTFQIELNSLQNGLYLLELEYDNHFKELRKVVKIE